MFNTFKAGQKAIDGFKGWLINLAWYPKQLLPFKYDTTYIQDGKKYACVWQMWLGRSFNIKRWQIVNTGK